MRLGDLELRFLSDGEFWLDGGTLFGVVPKVLWEKVTPPDEKNRVRMRLNVLLVQAGGKNVLVETGVGTKLGKKQKEIYRLDRSTNLLGSLSSVGLTPEDIDVVINTHLHFDHCGGNTRLESGRLVPTFPKAKYFIQKGEWEDALDPDVRSAVSYLEGNFVPLEKAGQVEFLDGDAEILPGIRVSKTGGHTRCHQAVYLESGGRTALFAGDILPMSYFVKIPYIPSFDLYPMESLEVKKNLLEGAREGDWTLFFCHDPRVFAGRLEMRDGKPFVSPLRA
jgi:glyoxylase-like metal-dependent hydrolase (beta-lactamase superfamily II)